MWISGFIKLCLFFAKFILEGVQGPWHSILPLWFPAERSTWRQVHLQVFVIKLSQCPEKHFTLICRHVIFSSVLPARMKRLEIVRMVPFLRLVSLKKIDFTLRYKHALCSCLCFMYVHFPSMTTEGSLGVGVTGSSWELLSVDGKNKLSSSARAASTGNYWDIYLALTHVFNIFIGSWNILKFT